MNLKNKRILEALQMQPLSQEEMTARHILGRLYGPIATCKESTRNGRLYNKPLWEKALQDDIFLEKVATKALFLELGHPADREETDMKQACACIPEVPKIVGDDLYAYVDILDTPNGRLLKTLVDYGFVPGISSRGSGDVMDDNQVDPETFFLETWDIVQLPAVKKARLNVCESLNIESNKLKKALIESYKTAKKEDQDTMKKALENLNIDIENDLDSDIQTEAGVKRELSDDDIPWAPDEEPLTENADELETDPDLFEDVDDVDEIEDASEDELEDDLEDESNTETDDESEEPEESEESEDFTDDDTKTEKANDVLENKSLEEVNTVEDAINLLKEYDKKQSLTFEITKSNGDVCVADKVDYHEDDDKLVLNVYCCEDSEDSKESSDDADLDIEASKSNDEESDVENDFDVVDDVDTADDVGDIEVIESLKDMIRQKEALETEVSDLRKAKSVGDAKEQELQEKLNQYRLAFRTTNAKAAEVSKLQSKIEELTESLNRSKRTIKSLTEKANSAQQLKESINNNEIKVRRLTEEVSQLTKQSKTLKAKLDGQTKLYTKKLQERTDLAKSYKSRLTETLTRYIEYRADMLNIQPSEIISRLNENYTLADVDAICDQILDTTINFSRLPFGGRSKTSARIAESVSRQTKLNTRTDPDYGYEVDDSLLELAGLKK